MKKLGVSVVLAVLIVAANTLNAGWITTYGGADYDGGYSVCESSDQGFVIAGKTAESLLIFQVNSEGTEVWNHAYEEMNGTCVIPASKGGYVVTGSKQDRWLGQTLLVMKTDVNGDSTWTTIHGKEGCEGNSIIETSDGGYVITGTNGTTLWILKVDSLGLIDWSKSFGASGRGYCIRETSDGGYVVVGSLELGEEREDLCIIKVTSDGDSVWLKTYGGFETIEQGNSIVPIGGGGYFIAGRYGSDIWLLETDSEGDTLWSKVDNTGRIEQLCQTSDGNYVITGMRYGGLTKQDLMLLKINTEGNRVWLKTYGGDSNEQGYSILEPSEGGLIIAGQTQSYGAGNFDVWLVRTNSAGDTAAVAEAPLVTYTDWEVTLSVGQEIVLRYQDSPQGFHAEVFDARGSRVGEMQGSGTSGILTWGEGRGPGVYFIKPVGLEVAARKVVLVR
ncbi:hypothetical protein JXM67_06815 [candidate division WOR-3 bacterium]|nr:hypothetical protein [candidate division WOR-3 bacterium]